MDSAGRAGDAEALLTALLTAFPEIGATPTPGPPTLASKDAGDQGAREVCGVTVPDFAASSTGVGGADGGPDSDGSVRRGASLKSTLPQLPQNFAGSITTV